MVETIMNSGFGDFSVIIIDEIHERTTASDLLLGMAKVELQKEKQLKIVIVSETAEREIFSVSSAGVW